MYISVAVYAAGHLEDLAFSSNTRYLYRPILVLGGKAFGSSVDILRIGPDILRISSQTYLWSFMLY